MYKEDKSFNGIGIIFIAMTLIATMVSFVEAKKLQNVQANPVTQQQTLNENSQSINNEALTAIKSRLTETINGLKNYFKKIEIEIQSLEELGIGVKKLMLQDIGVYLQRINELQQAVLAAYSVDNLKSIASETRSLIDESRRELKKLLGKRLVKKIENFSEKSQKFFNFTENKIAKLKNSGKTVAKTEQKLADCRNLVEISKKSLQQAKENFDRIQSAGSDDKNIDREVKTALQKMKEARKNLENARNRCKKFTRHLRRIR